MRDIQRGIQRIEVVFPERSHHVLVRVFSVSPCFNFGITIINMIFFAREISGERDRIGIHHLFVDISSLIIRSLLATDLRHHTKIDSRRIRQLITDVILKIVLPMVNVRIES